MGVDMQEVSGPFCVCSDAFSDCYGDEVLEEENRYDADGTPLTECGKRVEDPAEMDVDNMAALACFILEGSITTDQVCVQCLKVIGREALGELGAHIGDEVLQHAGENELLESIEGEISMRGWSIYGESEWWLAPREYRLLEFFFNRHGTQMPERIKLE